jgi:hypothetical protein
MRLNGGHLEWLAELSPEESNNDHEEVIVLIEGRGDECREPEELLIRMTVEKCGCLNGGWCMHEAPASSMMGDGHPGCECPDGFSGMSWNEF